MVKLYNYSNLKNSGGFEGWYFKCTLNGRAFAFIAGICHNLSDRHSFIQFVDSLRSHYFRFDYNDFEFNRVNKQIKINRNTFSLNAIDVRLNNAYFDLECTLEFKNQIYFSRSVLNPTSMGAFSYLPFHCAHSIVMLGAASNGSISINGYKTTGNGFAYVEKDLGKSFPRNYIWLQGNDDSFCFSFAQAHVFGSTRHICIIYLNGVQYNLSSYNKTQAQLIRSEGGIHLSLFQKNNRVEAQAAFNNITAQKLLAPSRDGLSTQIMHNLSASLSLSLNLNNETITATLPAAIEIV